MRTLYHYPLEPRSRVVRLVMSEKSISFDLEKQIFWERSLGFLRLNPSGNIPVLVENDGSVVAEMMPIIEYLNERYTDSPNLMGNTIAERAEVRRLCQWFGEKFYLEVVFPLLTEKVWRYISSNGTPNSEALRAAYANMETHFNYVEWLTERRNFLAGSSLTAADLCAAAYISCIDYLGAVTWHRYNIALEWYARIKSRRCFRDVLKDRIDRVPPSDHYANLDF